MAAGRRVGEKRAALFPQHLVEGLAKALGGKELLVRNQTGEGDGVLSCPGHGLGQVPALAGHDLGLGEVVLPAEAAVLGLGRTEIGKTHLARHERSPAHVAGQDLLLHQLVVHRAHRSPVDLHLLGQGSCRGQPVSGAKHTQADPAEDLLLSFRLREPGASLSSSIGTALFSFGILIGPFLSTPRLYDSDWRVFNQNIGPFYPDNWQTRKSWGTQPPQRVHFSPSSRRFSEV